MRYYKLHVTAACFALLVGCSPADKPSLTRSSPPPTSSADIYSASAEIAEPNTDQRAVWLTYIELADMFSQESCAEDFRTDCDELFGQLADIGINTIYAHVRAFGDAFYASELFAPTKYLTFDCDPLAVMTEQAHAHGLMIHAWINPLRCDTSDNMYRSEGYTIGKWYSDPERYTEYIVRPEGDDHYWLDPAVPEVRQLAADGVRELCENYDIDGVHIDDYFYPTTDPAFDSVLYSAADTEMSLSEWRTENCSLLVSGLYSAVKSVRPDIPFGISPQGNIDNNYSALYADVGRWCAEDGFCDYIAPQIYFGYDNPVCPFTETLAEWENMVRGEKQLIVGLGMYKTADGGELSGSGYSGVIASQIEDVLNDAGCGGFAVYRCSDLLDDSDMDLRQQSAAAAAVIAAHSS